MTDYRLKENRREYFDALYAANLHYGTLPGLVYLYLPELARRLAWDEEQKLWAAFLNGLTQNPVTTLVLMEQLPGCPEAMHREWQADKFGAWFNKNWEYLQFDTDRRYAKKLTMEAIKSYALLAGKQGGQVLLLTATYPELWARMSQVTSFGRLSTFSYLEYVRIMGHGAECDDLMFGDLSGSRSHRNGMLMLKGLDHLVMDKRAVNGVRGYKDLPGLAAQMSMEAAVYLDEFRAAHPGLPNVGNFTLESNLCQFKNSFFGRRYPGVYADMAWERILWAEAAWGGRQHTQIFRDIREDCLPAWLRIESTPDGLTIKQRAAVFPTTGTPYRAEHFL